MKENANLFDGAAEKKEEEAETKEELSPEVEKEEGEETKSVALGAHRSPPISTDSTFTCILCQEEEKLANDGKTLVMAAFVQKSTVLSNKKSLEESEEDKLSVASAVAPEKRMNPCIKPDVLPSDLYMAPHISSCGHVMHSGCFQHFLQDIVTSELQRSRMRQPQSYDVEKREFLCPMCRCLSNSTIPLIPQFQILQPPALLTPEQELQLGFADWVQAMTLATKYIKEIPPTVEESPTEDEDMIDPEEDHDRNQHLLYTCPLIQIVQELQSTSNHPAAAETFSGIYSELENRELDFEMQLSHLRNAVNVHVCEVGFGKKLSFKDTRTPMATWQATAFSLHSVVWACLDSGKRSVLDAVEMSMRHKECMSALIKFCGVIGSYFSEPKTIRSLGLKLLSILLEPSPLVSHLCILEVDAVGLLVPLTFTLPSLFISDFSAPLPAGNIHDSHILRLVYVLHLVQILLTTDRFSRSSEAVEKEDAENGPILSLLHQVRAAVGFASESDGTEGLVASAVWQDVKQASLPFLRCAALFYHHLTDVPGPRNLRHLAEDEFDVLTEYLSLPSTPAALLDSSTVGELVKRWTRHPRMTKLLKPASIVTYPIKVNTLIPLPHDYSELINSTSGFTCPKSLSDEARVPAMCLICGVVVCSQSYCCQTELNGKKLGACNAHTLVCGGGCGIFLRVRDCKVVMLAGLSKGTFIQPPYVDEYGETDVGLKRGNPLHLSKERYRKVYKLWLNHSIPKEISSNLESNPYYITTPWNHL